MSGPKRAFHHRTFNNASVHLQPEVPPVPLVPGTFPTLFCGQSTAGSGGAGAAREGDDEEEDDDEGEEEDGKSVASIMCIGCTCCEAA